jgi:hypothetical protein
LVGCAGILELEDEMKIKLRFALALVASLLAVEAQAATQDQGPANAVKDGVSTPAGTAGYIPPRGASFESNLAAVNLTYQGGPVIVSAKVVFIFWGPNFNNAASPDYQYAQTLRSYRDQLGTTPEYNVITQYYQNLGNGNQFIQLANLGSGTPDWFDASTPPTNVTDALVQGEVSAYLATHAFDASTIYEVVLPSASYSSSGGDTSCGGPNLAYCAYHGYFVSGANKVKYSIEPYPSCGGCQVGGWTAAQNQEHFVCHETRESVTDQQLNAWYDASGNEADDKCAWSPLPFIGTGGYGYQYEWSNASSSCVRSVPTVNSPIVSTTAASGISRSAATLGGTVNPNGASTNAYFQWGTTTSYGNTTSNQNVGAGTTSVPYSANLSSLACSTTYHFQAVATNTHGTGFGGDQSFTTAACPSNFYTATPCRILDTRNGNPLTAGTTYEFGIAGFCGIASTAKSVSVNITVVSATTGGFLTFWPAQTPKPGTSTISFSAGQVRANNAILSLAPGFFGSPGAVWFVDSAAPGSVHIVIDINGYFQ